MTARLYPAGHLNDTAAIEDCWCGWRGPLSQLPHCERCTADKKRGTHHGDDYKHEGECRQPGCREAAVNYGRPGRKPQYGYHCRLHAVEQESDRIYDERGRFITDEDRAAAREASRPLAEALNAPLVHLDDEGADFVAWSISERRFKWPMVFTPEGYAVHQGEGCIGEQKRGICHHMKEYQE